MPDCCSANAKAGFAPAVMVCTNETAWHNAGSKRTALGERSMRMFLQSMREAQRARMEADAKAIYPRNRVERLCRWLGNASGLYHVFFWRSRVRAGDDPIAVRPDAPPQGRGATLRRFGQLLLCRLAGSTPGNAVQGG